MSSLPFAPRYYRRVGRLVSFEIDAGSRPWLRSDRCNCRARRRRPARDGRQSRGIVGISHDPSSRQLWWWLSRTTCWRTSFGCEARTTYYVHTVHYGHAHCQIRLILLKLKLSASSCDSRVTCLLALTNGVAISPIFPLDQKLSAGWWRLA